MVNVLMKSNVELITLTAAEFRRLGQRGAAKLLKEFADKVPEGRQLIEQALAVK